MSKTKVTYNFGWLGLLGVIFVVAKVFGIQPVAEWSWWLVLLPFYFGLAVILGLLFGGAIIAGIILLFAWLGDLWNRKARQIAREKARKQQEKEQMWKQLGGK